MLFEIKSNGIDSNRWVDHTWKIDEKIVFGIKDRDVTFIRRIS